ncbi:mannose-1-phosphate guanylyltransferase [Oceanithermus sp.]
MQSDFAAIILAGGKGERFWPLSRKERPKQFLRLLPGGQSLIAATASRLLPVTGWERLFVSTSRHLVPMIKEHLPELPEENLIVEPEPRDTAPAIAWASLRLEARLGPDQVVGVFPADHYISDVQGFQKTLDLARMAATSSDYLVTIGIKPSYPSTAFGYIERGEEVLPGVFKVNKFVEKPNLEKAKEYLKQQIYFWNAGMFIFGVGTVLEVFKKHAPEIINPLVEKGEAAYEHLPKISFDYAVMEHTKRAAMVPASFVWDDLGDWTALERLLGGESCNVELAKHIGIDTEGAIIYATDDDEVIVTLGVKDIVIVRDGKITLVVSKDRVQEIKRLLKIIRERRMSHLL